MATLAPLPSQRRRSARDLCELLAADPAPAQRLVERLAGDATRELRARRLGARPTRQRAAASRSASSASQSPASAKARLECSARPRM